MEYRTAAKKAVGDLSMCTDTEQSLRPYGTSSKHAVSCIRHRLAIQFLHDSIHVRMSFSLVHGDDPERCYGEGGGRGVHVWERM